MIPATSRAFVLTNLVPGLQYDLCVLAVWDDAATALTATNVVGCAQFATGEDFPRCQSLRGGFLGGTMILVVGGVVVATLLVFIVVLMVRYKATGGGLADDKLPDVSNTYSQTNGGLGRFNGAAAPQPPPAPQVKSTVVVMREEMVEFKCGSLQSSLSSSSSSSNSLDSQVAGPGRRGAGPLADRYGVQGSECSTLPSSKFRRHGAKGRPNLDHLLGAFASLELRGAAARDHHQGAASTPTGSAAASAKTDRVPLLGRAESTSMLGRLLGLPQEVKPKRSRSFDMGHMGAPSSGAAGAGGASAQLRSGHARRISNIWTKRSLSVNGMLLQYDESEDEKPAFESSEWVMESTV